MARKVFRLKRSKKVRYLGKKRTIRLEKAGSKNPEYRIRFDIVERRLTVKIPLYGEVTLESITNAIKRACNESYQTRGDFIDTSEVLDTSHLPELLTVINDELLR